ncbi:stage V sporulation protein S [Lysinibacillus phage vB_LfM_LysYB1]|nr:stage V sporulation protein S [Lysinibacillus phage vB_LfM_LysYB1]WAB25388.1 stage V sporulation protein S [Lysinibacillus phage vB_LfM_LysYB2]
MTQNLLKVSSKSNPNSVAGALVAIIREQDRVEMQAVGAGALNQAVKAVAISRGFIAPMGIDLVMAPSFIDLEIGGDERTGIKLVVEKRNK